MRAETRKERILSMVAAILVLIGGIGAGWSLAWLERQVNGNENYTPIGFEGIYAPEPMVGDRLDIKR